MLSRNWGKTNIWQRRYTREEEEEEVPLDPLRTASPTLQFCSACQPYSFLPGTLVVPRL